MENSVNSKKTNYQPPLVEKCEPFILNLKRGGYMNRFLGLTLSKRDDRGREELGGGAKGGSEGG